MQIAKASMHHPRSFVRAVAALAVLCLNSGSWAGDPTKTVAIDCGAGDTITKALTLGDDRKPMVVLVSGVCSESVLIDRNDVTLAAGATGATVSGPDPATDAITVTASRVTIDGLTVTSGRNGITADGAPGFTVHGTVVQGTGRNGIVYARGASGMIDASTVTGNARDGVSIDSASATIINSQITQNGRNGINVALGGSVRIGIDNANNPAGNTIGGNASIGISIVFGSTAFIAMNQITGNGTSAAPGNPRFGVSVNSASADIVGGNTISGNGGQGIFVRSSAVGIGDTNFGFTTVNTITGNGNPASPGGIFGFQGSSLNIRDAVVSNNSGFGIQLSLRSQVQIASSTIQNNLSTGPGTGDGIRLMFGSALLAQAPNSTVTGNAGFGLNCTDGESSVVSTVSLGVGTNGLGGISPACTGF